MIKEQIFETAIDKCITNGEVTYTPHIRIKESIAKRFSKNWRGLVHSDLLEMFPILMNKLAEVGVNSNGRELYDKELMGKKTTTDYDTALAVVDLYKSTLATF